MQHTLQEEKKISAADLVIHLLHHANTDRKDLFYKAAEDYLKSTKTRGEHYHRVRRLIAEKPMKLVQLDSLSDNVKKLISTSIITDDNVYLNDDIKNLVDELIVEWKNIDVYKYHNLPIRNKILLHGTTGNGKTTIARHISKLAGLPFVEVKSDFVVSSSIGSSGKNIYNIFDSIKEPCILFWDEVDTIGRLRGQSSDDSASMENERMVNSILVNIEKLSNEVIFIGATNRKEVLDSAFLRRFDVQFELQPPTEKEKDAFINQMIEYYKIDDSFFSGRRGKSDLYDKNSYSAIKQEIVHCARKHVLSKLKTERTYPQQP